MGDVDADGVGDYFVSELRSGRAYSGISGQVLWEYSQLPNNLLLSGIACIGDWTGDGVPDLAVARSGFQAVPIDDRGIVTIHSGDTGAEVARVIGEPGDVLGFSLGQSLDVNGDGFRDLVVGLGISFGLPDARVYLGPNFELLREHSAAGIGVPRSIASLGDLDGDGCDDYGIGWHEDSTGGQLFAGLVRVFSGASGLVLHEHFGQEGDRLGWQVDCAGDVNGDGIPDYWASAPAIPNGDGYAKLFSGATGQLLRRVDVCNYDQVDECRGQVGSTLEAGGDLNGDGVPDAMIGMPGVGVPTDFGVSNGLATVVSGETGQAIWQVLGGGPSGQNEGSVGGTRGAILGDLNGDGFEDFAVSYRDPDYDDLGFGRVRIFAGGPGDAQLACPASPNTSGAGALLEMPFAISVSGNIFRLRASAIPAGSLGLFFYGGRGPVTPFGAGELCVANRLVRMGGPLDVGPSGVSLLDVDLQSGPYTSGPLALQVGSTWRFQFWYLDSGTGGGVNLSEARDVTFAP